MSQIINLECVKYVTSYSKVNQICPECKEKLEKVLTFQDILGHELPPFFWANRIGTPSLQSDPVYIKGKPQIICRCNKCDLIVMSDDQSDSSND